MESLFKYWKNISPLTRKLFIFAGINILLANLVLIVLFSTSWEETILFPLNAFFTRKEGYDSWNPMIQAFHYVQSGQQTPLYQEIFFNQKTKFQYPPSSLLSIYFIENFIPNGVRCLKEYCYLAGSVASRISWLFMLITVVFSVLIFKQSLALNTKDNQSQIYGSKIDSITRLILLICFALTFYPVIQAYKLGQIQTWINALFTIAFWSWMQGKTKFSGILTGIICLIKPQYVVILLWGLIRKKWAFALASSITVAIGFLVSVALFGLTNHLDYLNVLSYLSKHGEAFYTNQSMNGLLNRLLFNGKNLKWLFREFPPFNPWVYGGTLFSSLALLSVALLRPLKSKERGSAIDFAIIGLTCTIASPIAWEHHYGILLPIYAFLFPCLLTKKVFGSITTLLFCLSYLLSSNYFDFIKQVASIPIVNVLQSYLFFGGLLVLAFLYALEKATQPEGASAIQSPEF